MATECKSLGNKTSAPLAVGTPNVSAPSPAARIFSERQSVTCAVRVVSDVESDETLDAPTAT
jgi:hypothetical protein